MTGELVFDGNTGLPLNITEQRYMELKDEVDRLTDQNNELIAVLEKIADLHRGPGSALAQSALDTMRALEKP